MFHIWQDNWILNESTKIQANVCLLTHFVTLQTQGPQVVAGFLGEAHRVFNAEAEPVERQRLQQEVLQPGALLQQQQGGQRLPGGDQAVSNLTISKLHCFWLLYYRSHRLISWFFQAFEICSGFRALQYSRVTSHCSERQSEHWLHTGFTWTGGRRGSHGEAFIRI